MIETFLDLLPQSLVTVAVVCAGVFIAGFARGYSGFGSAAITVASASLVLHPAHAVAIAIVVEVIVGTPQAWSIRHDVAWRPTLWVLAGAVTGMSFGLWALVSLDAVYLRIAIASLILFFCCLLLAGVQPKKQLGPRGFFAVGIISGVAMGAAVSGLPVGTAFTADGWPAKQFRATMVMYLGLITFFALGTLIILDQITLKTLAIVAVMVPFSVAGILLGTWRFRRAEPGSFRRFVLLFLIVLSLAGIGRSVF